MSRLKFAIIGCGAIVQRIHLPVIAQSDCAEVTLLVDKDLPRAREVADKFGMSNVAADYRVATQDGVVDAAIVAIPNFLHAPVSIELLRAGIHVLVEKPMALNSQDCDMMIEAADAAGVALTVGLDSRFDWEMRVVKQMLETGLLGDIQRFDVRRGDIFSWPVTSSYTFDRARAGGGVMIDIGPHVLDQLLWWFGDYQSFHYWDDAVEGVEANCRLDLQFKNGISGTVELSRDRKLRNSWLLYGARATLEISPGLSNPTPLRLWLGEQELALGGYAAPEQGRDPSQRTPYRRQLADFCDAIRNHREPFVGRQGKKNIELIEACYNSREPIDYPWRVRGWSSQDAAAPSRSESGKPKPAAAKASVGRLPLIYPELAALSGKRVLITGGTGFIGKRLVQALAVGCRANVRVMARNFSRATGIARFPIELVPGDISQADYVVRAVEGCDIVIHGAAASHAKADLVRQANVGGTENVMNAALAAQIERVVHISSRAVYGFPDDGDLDETAPRKYSGMAYADTKLDAENVAFEFHRKHGLPVSIIQPACVYGPFGGSWTTGVLDQLKNEHVILVNGGNGLANPVHVDDVVTAILLAAVTEQAIGEAFLISDGERVTWQEFYTRYAGMVDGAELISAPAAELVQAYHLHRKKNKKKGIVKEAWSIVRQDAEIQKRLLRTPEAILAAKIARPFVPQSVRDSLKRARQNSHAAQPTRAQTETKPTPVMSPNVVRFFTPVSWVRIDKAKRLLGYQPMYDLETGIQLVEQWAKWANLI